ncbi:MAG TPA: hypothetical protein VF074_09650, partial [Pyrinomonadaceae bacterium]
MVNTRQIASYGSWKSPITADLIASGSVGLSQPRLDGDDAYWIELRPMEGGRNVIVKRSQSGDRQDLNPPPTNARTRVHEYGGGDYTVAGGVVYFTNFVDQRIYRQVPGEEPQPITPTSAMRYAELSIDEKRQRLLCVREDHSAPDSEAVNSVVSVNLEDSESEQTILASGNDFYSFPKLSPDGSQLAWTTWNHPNMPWDGCELWLADLAPDGTVLESRRVAGGRAESIFQPEWSPDGVLYFSSDRNGWWNLERVTSDGQIQAVYETKAELGMPQWVFGMSSYAFASPELIVCSHVEDGVSR